MSRSHSHSPSFRNADAHHLLPRTCRAPHAQGLAKTPPLDDGPAKKLELWRLDVAKANLLADDSDSSTDDSGSDVFSANKAMTPTSAQPPPKEVLTHCAKRRAEDHAAKL